MDRYRRLRIAIFTGIRQFFRWTVIGLGTFVLILIVNNVNIWTDGHRYRKRPRIEM